jgi:hypothetical protein
MKVVICTVPYMPPKAIHPMLYPVDGNKAIEYDKPVRCPINAILAKTLKKDEKVRLIYIMTTGETSYCEDNKENFIKELEGINSEIGAVLSYDTIEMDSKPVKRTYNKLITDLTEKIPEDAELYADITYGLKPEILSLFCALRFVEEFHNAVVEYFIWGQLETKIDPSGKEKPKKVNPMIFDITSLYYLFKLIGSIDNAEPEKASNILKDFFDL